MQQKCIKVSLQPPLLKDGSSVPFKNRKEKALAPPTPPLSRRLVKGFVQYGHIRFFPYCRLLFADGLENGIRTNGIVDYGKFR